MKPNYMEQRFEKIRLRAYEIWQAEGRPEGREQEFWRRAEAEPDEPDHNPEPTDGD